MSRTSEMLKTFNSQPDEAHQRYYLLHDILHIADDILTTYAHVPTDDLMTIALSQEKNIQLVLKKNKTRLQ